MSDPPTGGAPREEPPAEFARERDDVDEEPSTHPALAVLGDLGVYVMLAALALTALGLGAMATSVQPLGNVLVTAGIAFGAVALLVGGLVSILEGTVTVLGDADGGAD